ncbi:acyl-CoA dehydrogenase family protein [Polyangium mundeleinium]|uniref:Acyl-CoA dehydrogenase family protein n=1 Tax=Polyangium mundeleinium TaxID=2995306 RepID=A0ABT5EM38_9BACT|nr:acyl-CoA dehydrogenase family protein [Polyangium mundeleinium]MDC0742910.1 acyl-CoA dehydrogenase family protein [Polyangium mundeleinium]
MDFDLTDEQKRFQEAARALAARDLAPRAAEIDHDARLPEGHARTLGDAGLLGLTIPAEHGGSGGDLVALALVIEEIAAACASSAAIAGTHVALVARTLLHAGSDAQKQKHLAPLARGASLGAAAMPDPAEPASLFAEPSADGGFVLDGEAGPVILGPAADVFLVFAATNRAPNDPRLVALLVPKGAPGLDVVPAEAGVGRRAAGVALLRARGVRVDAADVIGAAGEGQAIATAALEDARIAVAAEAIGVARAAFEKAAAHVKGTQDRVKTPGLLGVQAQLADMSVEIEAARLLVLRAAHLADRGAPSSAERSIGKLFASEMSTRVAHRAMDILGARGGGASEGLGRHFRDARTTELVEESSGTQRSIIAQTMLKA